MDAGWIFTINYYKNLIFIGPDDNSIKVYNPKTLELVEELFGHDDLVNCLVFNEKFVYSGSYDHTIRTWDVIEIMNRIRERRNMQREELLSRKMEAYNKVMEKGKKKSKKNIEKEEEKSPKKAEEKKVSKSKKKPKK